MFSHGESRGPLLKQRILDALDLFASRLYSLETRRRAGTVTGLLVKLGGCRGGAEDSPPTLRGSRSHGRNGSRPELVTFQNPSHEDHYVASVTYLPFFFALLRIALRSPALKTIFGGGYASRGIPASSLQSLYFSLAISWHACTGICGWYFTQSATFDKKFPIHKFRAFLCLGLRGREVLLVLGLFLVFACFIVVLL
jgi:hypothetical protein